MTSQALKVIPVFDGEKTSDSHAFQNACEFSLQNIDPKKTENFLKGITIRLIEKAYRPFQYKKVKTYEEFKSILSTVVGKKATLSCLHSKLAMIKITFGESIQQYFDRTGQLFYDVIEQLVTAGNISYVDSIQSIVSKQVLIAFVERLPHDIRIIVKSAIPDKLEEVVEYALKEETLRMAQQEMRRVNSEQTEVNSKTFPT